MMDCIHKLMKGVDATWAEVVSAIKKTKDFEWALLIGPKIVLD